jgi:Ca2+-binding EF-hand superfamily protein
MKVAHYEAYKELMCRLATSGETLVQYIPEFFAMTGVTDLNANVSKQQYLEHLQKTSGPSCEQDIDRLFKHYDLDKNGQISFGEYVSMNFAYAHLQMIVNAQCPAPGDIVMAFDDDPTYKPASPSASFQSDVLAVAQKYTERLQAKADGAPVEIMSTETPGIFQRLTQSAFMYTNDENVRKQAEAVEKGMVAAQLAFIKVLCGGSEKEQGKAALETWMGHESNVFDKFDTDHNSMLDVAELSACLSQKVSYAPLVPCPSPFFDHSSIDFEALAKHFVELFDVNQDGGISKAEWIVARAAYLSLFIVSSQYTGSALPMRAPSNTMLTYQSPYGAPVAPMMYAAPLTQDTPTVTYGPPTLDTYDPYALPPPRKSPKKLKKRKEGGMVTIGMLIGVPVTSIFLMGFLVGRWSRRG